jgi:hypothetical protein
MPGIHDTRPATKLAAATVSSCDWVNRSVRFSVAPYNPNAYVGAPAANAARKVAARTRVLVTVTTEAALTLRARPVRVVLPPPVVSFGTAADLLVAVATTTTSIGERCEEMETVRALSLPFFDSHFLIWIFVIVSGSANRTFPARLEMFL